MHDGTYGNLYGLVSGVTLSAWRTFFALRAYHDAALFRACHEGHGEMARYLLDFYPPEALLDIIERLKAYPERAVETARETSMYAEKTFMTHVFDGKGAAVTKPQKM